jgi:predicted acyltransferase
VAGPAFEPVLLGAAAMLTLWLILYWMYRRKLFLKV